MNFMTTYTLAFEFFKVALPSIIAFLAWFQARKNQEVANVIQGKVDLADDKIEATSGRVIELHDGVNELKITVDGRLSQLLKLTASSEFARGQKDHPKLGVGNSE